MSSSTRTFWNCRRNLFQPGTGGSAVSSLGPYRRRRPRASPASRPRWGSLPNVLRTASTESRYAAFIPMAADVPGGETSATMRDEHAACTTPQYSGVLPELRHNTSLAGRGVHHGDVETDSGRDRLR